MPSVLSDDEKQTVKRTVPKASNKIHAVAVAKLYVAHPNRQRWTYTGLQGAVVLANDLVGNTFWLKLVDVSVSEEMCQYAYTRLTIQAVQQRSNLGPRDLRHVPIQPGSHILSQFRIGAMYGWSVVCGRKGGKTIQEEDG